MSQKPTAYTRPAPLPRGPFVLLGLMTATTISGPLLIGLVLKGGPSPTWPPDRAVEWVAVLGTSALVLVLMGLCLSMAWTTRQTLSGEESPANSILTIDDAPRREDQP